MGRRISHLGRALPGIVAPLLLTVALAVVILRLLNVLPAHWQNLVAGRTPAPWVLNERLDFSTIEQAEEDLDLKVLTPSYFPSNLTWPPASIRGQREPVRVVSLLFHSSDGRQALQIREIFWTEKDLPFPVPEPMEVLETREVGLDGTEGRLLLGQGLGGEPVNQLRWQANGVHLVLTTVFSAEELLRIAESIHLE